MQHPKPTLLSHHHHHHHQKSKTNFISLLMEMLRIFSLRKQWRRSKYRRLYSSNSASRRKSVAIVRLGGNTRRAWRIRSVPKFRFKLVSPLTLWKKFKSAYTNMMLNLAGNVGSLNDGNAFAVKRIPAVRVEPLPYDKNEFENRLVYEIYKSLVTSLELNSK